MRNFFCSWHSHFNRFCLSEKKIEIAVLKKEKFRKILITSSCCFSVLPKKFRVKLEFQNGRRRRHRRRRRREHEHMALHFPFSCCSPFKAQAWQNENLKIIPRHKQSMKQKVIGKKVKKKKRILRVQIK